MKKIISMNSRGTVTLPRALRQRLGVLGEGGSLIAEETSDGVLLRPGTIVPVEIYTPERIEEFQQADEELAPFAESLKKKKKTRTRQKKR